MNELTNEQCRDQALKMLAYKNFAQAMRWYNTARARTIGYKKSNTYSEAFMYGLRRVYNQIERDRLIAMPRVETPKFMWLRGI